MRSRQRYLIMGLALTVAPIGIVVTAPPAGADCNSVGGTTVCSQGEVRGPDGVPRAATPVVPYPCEYDWYCGSDSDIDISRPPGGGGGGALISVVRAVPAPTRLSYYPHDPSTTR